MEVFRRIQIESYVILYDSESSDTMKTLTVDLDPSTHDTPGPGCWLVSSDAFL